MTVAADIQSLEPGAIWEGFEVDLTEIGGGVLLFHSHLQGGAVFWQGVEYSPYPVDGQGFDITTDKPAAPRLKLANVDRLVTQLCALFDDMVGARVVRRQTLVRYLDAVNFADGNPTADPSEHLPDEVWYVERKTSETLESVEFELSSPLNLNGMAVPCRPMEANHCQWAYRSADCGYTGPPVAKDDDTPTANPALDKCSKRITGCKLRFGANNPLPFGAFPASSLIRT